MLPWLRVCSIMVYRNYAELASFASSCTPPRGHEPRLLVMQHPHKGHRLLISLKKPAFVKEATAVLGKCISWIYIYTHRVDYLARYGSIYRSAACNELSNDAKPCKNRLTMSEVSTAEGSEVGAVGRPVTPC